MNTESLNKSSNLVEAFDTLCNLDMYDINCRSFAGRFLSSSIIKTRDTETSLLYMLNQYGLNFKYMQLDLMGVEKLKFLLYDGILSANKEV